ncbi:hypothetical protein GOP47_0021331 [Adiantum capillus-veneris]|uniref:Disease resistance R13L4/SHOC-2-like LRR domain-containing protein n=1 Tax=Adiantum capillus-veneris TaxID=13818 RepID=A0A9D4Z9J4_ADICA|nr:hypothetical protein GOP47_0021331 [Adiantum capillus-veneris]
MRKELHLATTSTWIHMVVAMLILSCDSGTQVSAITDPNDIEALKEVKASIDAATIDATSCVGSWDFNVDPCTSRFGEQFTCGIDCTSGGHTSVLPNASMDAYERVTSLQLDDAGYAGVLSPWLGNLTGLRFLRMSGNALRAEIPASIGMLSQLMMFDLSFNNLSGSIPDSILMLHNLQSLNLAHNKLVGSIPPFLNKLSYLTELRLESNQLSGPFPDLRKLGLLQMLDASNNRLSGPFPRQLPPSLCSVCLRNNEFSGKLPKSIATLNQLNVLDVSNNAFIGCVGDAMLAHPTLQQLNLSMNKLSQLRAHPKHVAKSRMVALDLSYNMLSGPLPSIFAGMRELASLSLRYNFFHGVIPRSYGVKAIANAEDMKPLERLMLDGNYLTGPLPAPFMHVASDRSMSASFVDNCFVDCPQKFTFCQGKSQKAQTLCRLFNSSP